MLSSRYANIVQDVFDKSQMAIKIPLTYINQENVAKTSTNICLKTLKSWLK